MAEHMNTQKPKKELLQKWSRKKKLIFILLAVLVLLGIGGLAVVKASDNPSFCGAFCHNMKPMYKSYSDSKSNMLAHDHAKAEVECHGCHQDSLTTKAMEGVKYVTGNFEDPMKTRKFSKDMCLKCHDYKKVIAKTNFKESNPHQSHNGQLECNQCHKMHESSTVYCAKCHDFKWMDKLPAYFKKQ